MDIHTAQAFFMWCTIINGALLTLSSLMFMVAKDWIYQIHSRWFPLSRETFDVVIYAFLGLYKILFITFNLTPWLVLLMIG